MPVETDTIVSAKSEKKEKEEQNRLIQDAGVQFAKTVRRPQMLGTFITQPESQKREMRIRIRAKLQAL